MHCFLLTCWMDCRWIHKSLDKADEIFPFAQVNFASLTTPNFIYQKICKVSPCKTGNVLVDWKIQRLKRSDLLKLIYSSKPSQAKDQQVIFVHIDKVTGSSMEMQMAKHNSDNLEGE